MPASRVCVYRVERADVGARVTVAPWVPWHRLASEDGETPRVPVAETPAACLAALAGLGLARVTIYRAEIEAARLMAPGARVPDAHLTGELWALASVTFERVTTMATPRVAAVLHRTPDHYDIVQLITLIRDTPWSISR